MTPDWLNTPIGDRVKQHEADLRPAWLWSGDGRTLLWANGAAAYFLAKHKKHGLKLAAPAAPIKGQTARIIRLGSIGRSSLSRVRFLAGDKPASSTCACTPLAWIDGKAAVLIVAVDPIEPVFAQELAKQQAVNGTPTAPLSAAPEIDAPAQPADAGLRAENSTEPTLIKWFLPENAEIATALSVQEQPSLKTLVARLADPQPPPPAPIAAAPIPHDTDPAGAADQDVSPSIERDMAPAVPASQLFQITGRGFIAPQTSADLAAEAALDRLDDEGGLQPDIAIAKADKFAQQAQRVRKRAEGPADLQLQSDDADADRAALKRLDNEGGMQPDIAAAKADKFAEQVAQLAAEQRSDPGALLDDGVQEANGVAAMAARPTGKTITSPGSEAVERVSRYNFDELSRILNDRVGETAPQANALTPEPTPLNPDTTGSGALINLGGETLVLNRLPLGILVFRDQQVLFANRAITEMTGYDAVEQLRSAGLAAIFPAAGGDEPSAGPVNHLVQRDGALVPVTARLQSISWQGRPALMLSASTTEVRTGHEAAVRAFAEAFAAARGDGYFETNRAGNLAIINAKASALFASTPADLVGRPLSSLLASQETGEFQAFLERPARFAETARPCVAVAGKVEGLELLVFAQGQAGVVSGYFGFVHNKAGPNALPAPGPNGEPEPGLLARISRGVRRPLNTIIGFSDLIGSDAMDRQPDDRRAEYANDIRAAGHEIAALVDELDDYVRLKDGRYLPERASIELVALLENCVQRVRQQAGTAQVIVRSAISEKLPRITADRASLAQAVLNLLASAIDQTPKGGAVVMSAQIEENGAIAIHVRDSSSANIDMGERFVVFRDGVGPDGRALTPVRSSVGLALTRSLVAVNAFSLKVDPAGAQGMLFSLLVPADLVDHPVPY